MRFLLPTDNEVYHELKNWISDNWGNRVPQKDQPFLIARVLYSEHDLEHRRISETMVGKDFDPNAFLLKQINHRYNYVADEVVIVKNERDYVYECKANMYPVQEEFIARYELLDGYYSKLIGKAMTFFDDRGNYHDNLYIESQHVWQFDRKTTGMNEWEPVNDRPIMTEEYYNEQLTIIKKEFDAVY